MKTKKKIPCVHVSVAGLPPIKLWIDPGDATSEDIQKIFRALSDLHFACGGDELTFQLVHDLPASPVKYEDFSNILDGKSNCFSLIELESLAGATADPDLCRRYDEHIIKCHKCRDTLGMLVSANIAPSIIVTTPKKEIESAAKEAAQCIANGGGYYYRKLGSCPKDVIPGVSRIFYVEEGFVRGFGVIEGIEKSISKKCSTTGKEWGKGFYVCFRADSWKWINPIPMKGFQGWRYFDATGVEVIGDWKDKEPYEN